MQSARRRRTAWIVAWAVPLLIACGKRGAPLPPSPRGPAAPTQVSARQLGQQVVVTFGVPAPRGDRPSQRPARAELVRVSYPPGIEAQVDAGAFRRRGEIVAQVAGQLQPEQRVQLSDTRLGELPAGGIGHSIRYAVRLRDARGRPSPLVVGVALVPLPAVLAPTGLRGEATAEGVRLRWDASTPGGGQRFNVYRAAADSTWPEGPINAEPLTEGAFVDRTVVTGEDYEYVVRVALADGRPYRESASSQVVRITAEDRFPPAAPQGLVAVQEGSAARLFWNPNAERDVRGYRIYRRRTAPGDEAEWLRIGPDPVDRPLFLDEGVAVGRVAYRVTAVDGADPPNESAPSAVYELEFVEEPPEP